MANVAIICKTIINLASKQKRKKEDLGIRRIRQDVNKTSHSNFSITPFRIENAQWWNVKRCKNSSCKECNPKYNEETIVNKDVVIEDVVNKILEHN